MDAWINFGFESILLFLITLIFVKYLTEQYLSRKRIPGPYSWPFFGHFFNLGSCPHKLFTEMSKKYGDVFQLQIGLQKVVVLNGYQIIKETLADQATEFAGRPVVYSGKFLQSQGGFIFADFNDVFKESRKISVKALGMFVNPNNERFIKILQDGAKLLVDALDKNTGKPYYPLDDTIAASGFITTATIFGRTAVYDEVQLDISQNCARFEAQLIQTDIPDYFPVLEFWFNNREEKWKTFFLHLKEWCGNEARKHEDNFCDDQIEDVMDALLQIFRKQSNRYTDNQLTGLLADLMEAGIGTTNSTLVWTILLLATHQDIQSQVQKELDSVLPNKQQISLEDASKLPYLEAFILEVHRFASIVPLDAFHRTTKNASVNGILIPNNTFIIPNLWSVHRDERIWENPDVFDPKRFLLKGTDEVDITLVGKIFPFSAGRRRCPGEAMSKMQLFLLIANLIQHFTFECPDMETLDFKTHIFAIVVWPQPYKVIIKNRI